MSNSWRTLGDLVMCHNYTCTCFILTPPSILAFYQFLRWASKRVFEGNAWLTKIRIYRPKWPMSIVSPSNIYPCLTHHKRTLQWPSANHKPECLFDRNPCLLNGGCRAGEECIGWLIQRLYYWTGTLDLRDPYRDIQVVSNSVDTADNRLYLWTNLIIN